MSLVFIYPTVLYSYTIRLIVKKKKRHRPRRRWTSRKTRYVYQCASVFAHILCYVLYLILSLLVYFSLRNHLLPVPRMMMVWKMEVVLPKRSLRLREIRQPPLTTQRIRRRVSIRILFTSYTYLAHNLCVLLHRGTSFSTN